MGSVEIALADAVAVVRDELLAAAQQGADADVRFEVEQVQVEFTVDLREDSGAKGGFKAWVLSGDAERSSGATRGHRVAVTLRPHPRGELLVAGEERAEEGPGDVTGRLGR